MVLKNVVLVHGAWADGSSWGQVILKLEGRNLKVRAAQLPITSFADDVAAVRRVVALMDGPTLLVGHSYGGVVITEAGNDPNVAALVYVAAIAPDEGAVGPIVQDALGPGASIAEPDADGFLWLNQEKYPAYFAQDVEPSQARIMAATQKPVNGQIFTEAKIQTAAWKDKPAFFLVADNDQIIKPAAEREFAERMKAVVRSVSSSHVPMVSQPEVTAAFIAEAANK